MLQGILPYLILQYIVDNELKVQGDDEPVKLPAMDKLADKLGISMGKLREELIAARTYGVVEMRPGDGTYVQPFDFYAAIRALVLYSAAYDWRYFEQLYTMRVQMERAFWDEAVRRLTEEDMTALRQTLEQATHRLKDMPVEIPHKEHRELHLLIYRRLENQFAQGLFKAYWDAYEAVGLHRYFDYSYYERMWTSHHEMVEAIEAGQYDRGKEVLTSHFTLLEDRLQGSPGA